MQSHLKECYQKALEDAEYQENFNDYVEFIHSIIDLMNNVLPDDPKDMSIYGDFDDNGDFIELSPSVDLCKMAIAQRQIDLLKENIDDITKFFKENAEKINVTRAYNALINQMRIYNKHVKEYKSSEIIFKIINALQSFYIELNQEDVIVENKKEEPETKPEISEEPPEVAEENEN